MKKSKTEQISATAYVIGLALLMIGFFVSSAGNSSGVETMIFGVLTIIISCSIVIIKDMWTKPG